MSSLLERLGYIINDIFGKKTYAESQRDKYKNVVNRLQKQLEKTGGLEEVLQQLKTDYNTMEINPDSAAGKLSTTYVTKEATNRQSMEAMGTAFQEAISDVRTKLAFAQEEYEYWCGEAEREDREMKIYQRQYYEEEERLRREAEQQAAQQQVAEQQG